MNKKALIVILAITSSVTAFALGSTWVLRPNSATSAYADQIFQEAKARQQKPIVSVAEPLKTDVEAISDEDRLAQKVAQILSSDSGFLTDISDFVKNNLDDDLGELETAYKKEVVESANSVGDSYKSEIKQYIDDSNSQLRQQLDENLAISKAYSEELSDDNKAYIDRSISALKETLDKQASSTEEAINTKSTETQSYIDEKTDSIISYVDSSINKVKEEFSTAINEANSHAEELVSSDRKYVEYEVTEEITEEVTDVEYIAKEADTYSPISIYREMPLLSDKAIANAYNGYGAISFPSFVTVDDIESGIRLLESEYPEITDVAAFFPKAGSVMAIYPQALKESDISYGLDIIETLLASYHLEEDEGESAVELIVEEETPSIEVAPSVAEEVIEVKPVEEGAEEYSLYIHREIPLFDSFVIVDAYDGNATISLPGYVTEEEIADCISLIYKTYPTEAKDFDFAIDSSTVGVLYSTGYTEEELNGFIDSVITLIGRYIDSLYLKEIAIPKAPNLTKEAVLVDDDTPRVPAPPVVFVSDSFVLPQPDIADDDIPDIRNLIRSIIIDRYLDVVE